MRASRAGLARAGGTGLVALRAGLVLSVLLAGLVVGAAPAQACDCADPRPRQALANADAVFFGEVVARVPDDAFEVRTYTIAVEQVFKGDVAAQQQVVASPIEASCGIDLPARGSVLIYGFTESFTTGKVPPGQYATWLCSGSGAVDAAPAALGVGRLPESEPDDEPAKGSSGAIPTLVTPASDPWMPFVVGGVVLVLLAGLGWALFASRPRPGDATSE